MDDLQADKLIRESYLQGIQDTLTIMRTVNSARPDPVRDVQAWLDRATEMGPPAARALAATTEEAYLDLATRPSPMNPQPNTPAPPKK